MAEFVPITIPPGLVKAKTPALQPGRWDDGNLVRWVEGILLPVPGWSKVAVVGTFASTIRAVHNWLDNSGIQRVAILCEKHLYILEGDTLTNITPSGGMTGPADDLLAGGYGDSVYGDYTYGDARPDKESLKVVGPAWTLDNWGEDLLAMTSYDGRLLRWKPSDIPGTLASSVPNAPTSNRTFTVTPERHVIVFGYGGIPNKFGWCHQEDIENWTPGITSLAGSYEVQPAAPIIAAILVKGGVLFFTTKGPNLSRYVGLPFVYSNEPIQHTSVPLTNASLVRAGNDAMWLADDGFWRCDGVSVMPVSCPLLSFVQENISRIWGRYRTFAMNWAVQPELWWFIPTDDSNDETNTALIYNYKEGWWSKATVARTCGVSGSYTQYPLLSDGTDLWYHENGWQYPGVEFLPWIETTSLNTQGGSKMVYADQMVVDHGGAPELVLYTVKGRIRRRPDEDPDVTIGPKFCRPDGYLDARLTARDITLKLETAEENLDTWTFGAPLVNFASRGAR